MNATSAGVKTIWCSSDEIKGIWDALHEYRYNGGKELHLAESILLECGVAESRAEVLYPAYTRIAVSLGKTEGGIPLKLSLEEFNLLTKLPLDQSLKEIIY
jgi:hypothetical protein